MAQGQVGRSGSGASGPPWGWIIAGCAGCGLLLLGVGVVVFLVVFMHPGGTSPLQGQSNPYQGHWTGTAQASDGAHGTFVMDVQADGKYVETLSNDALGTTTTMNGTIHNDGSGADSYETNGATLNVTFQFTMDKPNHAVETYTDSVNGTPVATGTADMTRQ